MSKEQDHPQDFVTWSTEILSTVSAFWILLLCAIFLYDIIGREAFDTPFLGTHEIVGNSIDRAMEAIHRRAAKKGHT